MALSLTLLPHRFKTAACGGGANRIAYNTRSQRGSAYLAHRIVVARPRVAAGLGDAASTVGVIRPRGHCELRFAAATPLRDDSPALFPPEGSYTGSTGFSILHGVSSLFSTLHGVSSHCRGSTPCKLRRCALLHTPTRPDSSPCHIEPWVPLHALTTHSQTLVYGSQERRTVLAQGARLCASPVATVRVGAGACRVRPLVAPSKVQQGGRVRPLENLLPQQVCACDVSAATRVVFLF